MGWVPWIQMEGRMWGILISHLWDAPGILLQIQTQIWNCRECKYGVFRNNNSVFCNLRNNRVEATYLFWDSSAYKPVSDLKEKHQHRSKWQRLYENTKTQNWFSDANRGVIKKTGYLTQGKVSTTRIPIPPSCLLLLCRNMVG